MHNLSFQIPNSNSDYRKFHSSRTPSGFGTHFNQTLYPPDHIPLSR
jgi:hypothetical protein